MNASMAIHHDPEYAAAVMTEAAGGKRIEVLTGQPCPCHAPPERVRDDDVFRIHCPQCGATWTIGLV